MEVSSITYPAKDFAEPYEEQGPRLSFGDQGFHAISVGGGAAFSDDSNDYQGYITYHTFLTEDFEFNVTASGWYFDQDGGDSPAGGNIAIGFRLYFTDDDRPRDDQWIWYAEAGIGLLASGEDVPANGSTFNFTPRAGLGVTVPLTDGGLRLDTGLRWHHISNASQFGTDDNPSRDSVMIYAGLMFPLN